MHVMRKARARSALAWAVLVASCGGDPSAKRPDGDGLPGELDGGQRPDGASERDASDDAAARQEAGTCVPAGGSLGWPVAGTRGEVWEVTNYVDLARDPGELEDFTGARGAQAKTYDGHQGVDISISSFRAMDQGVEVHAVARGEVIAVVGGFFDRKTERDYPECQEEQNYVSVRDPSGAQIDYLHLKKGSPIVAVGDLVEAGDVLALVGSSGCSLGPHVHLGVLDCDGAYHDPFAEELFANPPSYESDVSLMETAFFAGPIGSVAELQDPPLDPVQALSGQLLGVGAMLASGREGEPVTLEVTRANGSLLTRRTSVLGALPRLTYTFWNVLPDGVEGSWDFSLSNGERVLGERQLEVKRPAHAAQRVLFAVAPDDLASTLEAQALEGFGPRLLDGYDDGSAHAFNIVLDEGIERVVRFDLSASELDAQHALLAQDGLSPVHTDAYTSASGARYAAVFGAAADTRAYFGATVAEHATARDANLDDDYLPVALATINDAGTTRVSAVYAARGGASAAVRTGMPIEDYDARKTSEQNMGRFPRQLHVRDSGVPLIAASFTTFHPGTATVELALTKGEFDTEHTAQVESGAILRDLSAYLTNEGLRFAALWVAAE